ncbi:hypothetical protein J1N35_037914 [Gossypium stocksii]|uniref:Uncharacterized protein n=1 Tax=Gossypium stocksii TaxID=47602 RepID=A0A9D3ULF8_9ROSI|nr:hypothetical protein J1N35_037914 [Gossypium stocksii]
MNDEPVTSLNYPCQTMKLKMQRLPRCHELTEKHYKCEFGILEGTHNLSEVFEPKYSGEKLSFYLPIYLFEVRFTLPLSDFIWDLLNHYGVAFEQLAGIS